MKTYISIKKRGARLAILLTLLVLAPIGAKNCWGQAAGFAQSRAESPATAESGPRRLLANLNPFRQNNDERERERQQPLVTPTISQPVITATRTSVPNAPSAPPTSAPRATNAPTTSAAPREPATTTLRSSAPPKLASVRPHISPSTSAAASITRKSSTGGVASLLLDELEEEDVESAPTLAPSQIASNDAQTSSRTGRKVERRSLRADAFPSSLELLDAEDAGLETDDSESHTGPAMTFESEEGAEDQPEGLLQDEDAPSTPALAIEEDAPSALVEVEKADEESRKNVNKLLDENEAEDSKPELMTTQEPEVEPTPSVLDTTPKPTRQAPNSSSAPVESIDSRLDEVLAPRGSASSHADAASARNADAFVATSRAPNVLVDTIGPKKLVVGQESTYKIVARNVGAEPARKLVVTTDIPESVANVKARATIGEATFQSTEDRGITKRCVWNVGELAPGDEFALEIKLTPTKRAAFGLVSQFDFERASARAEVEVQEPILEALIEGRDSIEWGVEDKYRLRLRNIGNGDAEDVVLNVSTGENRASQKIGLLRAGDEKVVEMSVKTATDDYFVISVEAVGAYGLKATAEKKVLALRGRLDVQIETPDLQFVDGEFEATIRVKNLGAATLQNVDVVAQIPQDVEVLYCSNQARRNLEKRRIYWIAPFIRPNEETIFTARCRVTKSGAANFEVVGVDQTGLVAQARSQVNVEAIAVLAMRVNAPKEPIAVGKTCVYELVVENNGTRDAREVNTGIFLGAGIKPLAVEDNQGYVYPEDSKVLFKKIESLKAGERVVFRVKAEALVAGNQKVQAMLQSAPEDVSLLSEETTYCYSRRSLDGHGNSFLGAEQMTAENDSDSVRK